MQKHNILMENREKTRFFRKTIKNHQFMQKCLPVAPHGRWQAGGRPVAAGGAAGGRPVAAGGVPFVTDFHKTRSFSEKTHF